MNFMSSLFAKKRTKLNLVIPDSEFYLNNVGVKKVFEDKKPTDKIAGYVYTVTSMSTFDQINVLVEHTTPVIEPNELEALQEAGEKVFVEFENATLKPYYSDRTKSLEDSIKADNVYIVKEK